MLFAGGGFVAAGDVGVSLLAPGADGFGVRFGGGGGVVAVGGGGGYGAAWPDVLLCVSFEVLSGRGKAYVVSCVNGRERALEAVQVVVLGCSGGLWC